MRCGYGKQRMLKNAVLTMMLRRLRAVYCSCRFVLAPHYCTLLIDRLIDEIYASRYI